MKTTIKFWFFLFFIMLGFTSMNAQTVQKQKVILDFDIGDDFDDANALALLLAFVRVDDKGYTLIDESKKPNCEIATRFKMEEFLVKYTERMLKQNLMRK